MIKLKNDADITQHLMQKRTNPFKLETYTPKRWSKYTTYIFKNLFLQDFYLLKVHKIAVQIAKIKMKKENGKKNVLP